MGVSGFAFFFRHTNGYKDKPTILNTLTIVGVWNCNVLSLVPPIPVLCCTVENNSEHFVHCSVVVLFGGRNVWTVYRQGVNCLSIVGRLSTLQSVHYQRFHCVYIQRKQEEVESLRRQLEVTWADHQSSLKQSEARWAARLCDARSEYQRLKEVSTRRCAQLAREVWELKESITNQPQFNHP